VSPPPGIDVAVKALACELPSELGLPLSRFSMSEIKREAIRRGLVASIGETTIWRWLSEMRSGRGPIAPPPECSGSLTALEDRLLAFQDHYQSAAKPFQWRFTVGRGRSRCSCLTASRPQPLLDPLGDAGGAGPLHTRRAEQPG
jgi:hypothetical protein